MIRVSNIVLFLPRLLLYLLYPWPVYWIFRIFRPNKDQRMIDSVHWQALQHAQSYHEWEQAAEVLNGDDAHLIEWKADPKGEYDWSIVLDRTAQLEERDRQWRSKESRNTPAYRDLLMPVQARDIGYITKPWLHNHLWTGTKTAIEDYVTATVRGVRTVRKTEAPGAKLDDKNEWFKNRRMVLGRTALFLQGGSVFGLSHLGVMKSLFENDLLPEVIVGTHAGALMAALVGMRTDEELMELFKPDSDEINLDAFTRRAANRNGAKPSGWRVLAERLRRWWRTGKVLDPATLEQCIADNVGDMTFERAWQVSGRSICITIASDAPGTPNMLSWITAPNVLIRTAALASMEPHPDKCLDMILEKNSRGEVQPWTLNDETPSYRDRRRRKGWPGQKPPIWRAQELWHINHYIISASRPSVAPWSPGTHFWAVHRPGTPYFRLLRSTELFVAILQLVVLLVTFVLGMFRRRHPTSGLSHDREEQAIMPQRRCKPIEVVPDTSWTDLTSLLQNPTRGEIRFWMDKGERATWPTIRGLHVRMDIEIELHKKYRGDPEDKPRRTLADLCERLRQRRLEQQGGQ